MVFHSTKISSLAPNEVGDFVAGAAAPLAFLWLAVAVFLQKQELSLQRQELKESWIAQQRQVEETAELVEQNRSSVNVARDAQRELMRREREALLNRLIDNVAKRIRLRGHRLQVSSPNSDPRSPLGVRNLDDPDSIIRSAVEAFPYTLGVLEANWRLEDPLNAVSEISDLMFALKTVLEEVMNDNYRVLNARIAMLELHSLVHYLEQYKTWIDENPSCLETG